MSAKIVLRVGALLVILVAGLGYIAFDALQITTSTFPVDLRLPQTGGLFPNGFVTLRGVDVGRISSIQVQRDDVVVHLAIKSGTRIPADSAVKVRDLSAVGEQYVDFAAATSTGPYLKARSVMSAGSSAIPVSVSTLLHDGNSLADSINTPQVSTLLQTLTTALAGTGPQLRSLLDSATSLSGDLAQAQSDTTDVLDYGRLLLDTGIQTNPNIDSAGPNLAELSTQLKASNAALQAVLSEGPTATSSVEGVLKQDSTAINSLLDNSSVITSTAANDQPATLALFQNLPPLLKDLVSVATPAGIRVVFNFNDKNDVCSYANAPLWVPTDTEVQPLALDRSCPASKATDLEQRGAGNAPTP